MPRPLVVANSGTPLFREAEQLLLPYLEHFGIPFDMLNLLREPLPPNLEERPLIIMAHPGLDTHGRRLGTAGVQMLREAVERGAGLVSFDPALRLGGEAARDVSPAPKADTIAVVDSGHPITVRHAPGEEIALVGPLAVPRLADSGGATLLSGGGGPLLTAEELGRGRVARWATLGWAQTRVLGPLGGLDDVLWRSLVWAARKPFAMRGLPPLVTMRVDDVAGTGGRWGETPLGWARAAARHGLRPWLGLFLSNLTEPGIVELRELLESGAATAFPHAFGRPPRTPDAWLPYADDAPPLRAGSYDEFIYFDHERGAPWSDAEAALGLAAVDAWYAAHGPLPISSYAVGHWYEMGGNTIAHMADRWGVEFVGKVQDVDAPLRDETPWLRLGPFRRFEQPGTALFDPRLRGDRPVYYADFMNLGGRSLFNCVTEIRDDAGYEWAPDADVAETVGRGVRQLRRALDSFALASLFTHETDFIYKIPPAAWDEALGRIVGALGGYRPIFVTADEGVRYVRATRTGRLVHTSRSAATGPLELVFGGRADVPTHCYLFAEGDEELRGTLVDVPPFAGELMVRVEL
jgi:hypothetical protein